MESNGLSAYDAAEASLDALASRQLYDEKNRLALLSIHGWMGVLSGFLILRAGSPVAWQLFAGKGSDWMLAFPAFLGGTVLLMGLYLGRRLAAEAVGMALMLCWDLVMTFIFTRQALVEQSVTLYPTAVYAGLAALMFVHLRTLVRYLAEASSS